MSKPLMAAIAKTLSAFFIITISTAACATPANSVSLLNYMNASVQNPPPSSTIPKYNRAKQFGSWAHQDPDLRCRDTRAMVLERSEDHKVPIKFKNNGCTVDRGLWHEPYTGKDVRAASDLQIDHVVPLKAAYYAGAYTWPAPYRCHYANFIANEFHLLAVSGHENMSKGDRGPDEYLPPSEDELCHYVSSWMKVKMIWELHATRAEIAAIKAVVQRENCGDEFLYMNKSELAKQRNLANRPIEACADFGD